MPQLNEAIEIRPPSRTCIACLNPIPTSPITFSSGIRTLSNINSAVSLARTPNLSLIFTAEKPGVPFSTIKAVIPLLSSNSPVLTKTTNTSPDRPCVIQFFVPLRIQSFPSLTAVVFILMASEPVFDSVKPHAPIQSPLTNLGRYFNFCSSEPW